MAYSLILQEIEKKIYVIRGYNVMLDRDIAGIYGVKTAQLTRQVRRNISRFPERYAFQLKPKEFKNLICQFGTSSWGGARKPPYVFTEHGVVMLSSVLNSSKAVKMSIMIVEAFIKLRKFAEANKNTNTKIREHDIKLLMHDKKLKNHETGINVILGHIMKKKTGKKNDKKYGFRTK